jgi:hypothetical protein
VPLSKLDLTLALGITFKEPHAEDAENPEGRILTTEYTESTEEEKISLLSVFALCSLFPFHFSIIGILENHNWHRFLQVYILVFSVVH